MTDAVTQTTVDLDVILTGRLPSPVPYVFRPEGGNAVTRVAAVVRPGGATIDLACVAYVVRHPDAGAILIDTGFHGDARSRGVRHDFGTLMSLVFRGLRPAEQPFDAQLRELGVDPDAVDRVVMTHLHVDHTSGMRLLPRARFVCARAEWAAARARGAVRNGYAGHHLPDADRMQLLDLGADGEPHGPFARTIDLLGDGSVRLVSTPGHTRGHLSVLVRRREGDQALLIGDAVYTLRSIEAERLPLMTADDATYLGSLREIRAFGEREPDAILVPSHDPSAWRRLGGDGGS